MLEYACDRLDKTIEKQVALWVAWMLGYYFMLRRSEYTADNNGTFHPDVAVTKRDLVFMRGRKPCKWWQGPTGVAVYIKRSKTDTAGVGCWRYNDMSGHPTVCVVTALVYWFASQDEICEPSQSVCSFAKRCGKLVIGRQNVSGGQVSASLKEIGAALNVPSSRLSSHSLRVGGATALAAAGVPKHLIQLLGRWRSEAVMGYIHESLETMKGLARRMTLSVVAPLLFFGRPA